MHGGALAEDGLTVKLATSIQNCSEITIIDLSFARTRVKCRHICSVSHVAFLSDFQTGLHWVALPSSLGHFQSCEWVKGIRAKPILDRGDILKGKIVCHKVTTKIIFTLAY